MKTRMMPLAACGWGLVMTSLVGCTKDQPAVDETVTVVPEPGAAGERGDPADPELRYEEPEVEVTIPESGEEIIGGNAVDVAPPTDADDVAPSTDASEDAVTPIDQSNAREDLQITASIRQGVVDRDDVSMNAKNIKIVSEERHVTLRGPVESEEEKAFIDSLARGTLGVKSVDNQLQVVSH